MAALFSCCFDSQGQHRERVLVNRNCMLQRPGVESMAGEPCTVCATYDGGGKALPAATWTSSAVEEAEK